jgi:hypothetical protein
MRSGCKCENIAADSTTRAASDLSLSCQCVVGCQYTVCWSTSCWTVWVGGHRFVVGCQ